MKSKEKLSGEYRQMYTKLLVRAFFIFFAAVAVVLLLYRFALRGHIANWTVAVFENLFGMEYEDALSFYWRIFRQNADLLLLIGVIILFFVIFRINLNWFSKYFTEINRGIDSLIKEDTGDVVLPQELSASERKINAIRRTLEKRKQETQFAEQQKRDLVVCLAHDLKTPLTTVIGYLTLLRDEPEISVELRARYANIALEKAERLEQLINEFFDITRFSLTETTLEEETINLTRMLEQIVHELHPILAEEALTVEERLEPEVMLTCDPEKLRRVFDNLFRNAMHYSYKGTTVGVSLKRQEDQAVVCVTNRGKTIPPEKLAQIFEQFFRLDASRAASTGGAGLGLAIARRIVELHGGTIAAMSEAETIAFTVTLPGARQKTV